MIYIGNKEYIPYIGNKAVEYIYIGDKLYYSAIRTHTVTYYVDTSVIYSEDVEEGNTCLSPTTFTPSKSGYTFTGWREDNTANSSVLSSKVMDDEDISLYAVFQKNIVLTTYNNSPNATTQTKQQYYNNGNVVNPSFTLTQNTQSGWTPLGWCTSSSATASIAQNNGATITLSSNATYYGKYSQTITLSYNGNGATGGSTAAQTGTRYYNSGNYSNPSFSIRANGFSRTSYSFVNWAMGSTSGTRYSAGANITLSANTTMYAIWRLSSLTLNSANFNMGIVSQTLNYTNGDNGTASCGNTYVKWSFNDVAYYGCEIAAASTNVLDLRGYTRMTIDIEGEEYKELKVGFGTSRGSYNCGYVTSDGGSTNINISSSAVYLYIYGKFSENNSYKTARSCRLAVNSITLS